MPPPEERHCPNCGSFHLRNVSFFAYWTQCETCGTYLCPRCSGYDDRRIRQYAFLAYLLISFLFYLGAILIIGPILNSETNFDIIIFSYSFAAIIVLISFLSLILIVRSIIRRLARQNQISTTQCPKCKGSMRVIYHDLFLYFWLFLIHVLFIVTILNETGIFFYRAFPVYSSSLFSLSFLYVFLLISLLVLIILIFKRIGTFFFPNYKTNTRVWLGEIFAIFIYLSINLILLILVLTDDILFSFDLFYHFISIAYWFFPVFIIGSVIYRTAQKYLLNIKRSLILHTFIALIFIVGSFFVWGVLSILFQIYASHDLPYFISNKIEISFYSPFFNEILPLLILSLFLGLAIVSILKKYMISEEKNSLHLIIKRLIAIGTLIFLGFVITDTLYYVITGIFFFDFFASPLTTILLLIFIICCLILVIHELIFNWASSKSKWGHLIELKLGSLLYPVLFGFILVALSLSLIVLPLLSTSLIYLPSYSLITDIYLLKILFVLGLCIGIVIGFVKKSSSP